MSGEAPESGTNPPAAGQVPNASIHVFISYASQDADAIIRAISGAKVIVLVLSESAIASSERLNVLRPRSARSLHCASMLPR
jgi:hypothetical protein